MRRKSEKAGALALAASFSLFFGGTVHAQCTRCPGGGGSLAPGQLFNQVHTIAAPTTGVPQEFGPFTVNAAGTYTVTLTDLGAALKPTPAPLASVKLAVTGGDALVGAPLVGPGTLTLALAPSVEYQIHVVGMPGNLPGSGPFGIQVNNASMTQIEAYSGTLALPSGNLPNGEGVLDTSFMVGGTGSYTVTLTDLQLPQPLTTLTLLLIAQGSATPTLILPNNGSLQGTATLTAGVTYDIFAVGQANAAANAGLFGAVVSGAGGIVLGRAIPMGNTMLVGSPALKAGNDVFTLTDLNYPAGLSQVGAVLTLNGQAVAQLAAAGSQAFTATAATYDAFAVGIAPAAPGAGSYAVQVLPASGSPLFSVAEAVTASGSALSPFSFTTTLASGGAYSVTLTDFQFPSALVSVSLAAVQNGALLGTPINSATNLNITAASGPLSLLVFAQAGTGAAGGLFGVDLLPNGSASPAFAVTQAVGALFTAEQFSVTQAGAYTVTATDLGFPATFLNYDTIVTQGSKQIGWIFGGGTFNFTATPGDYFVNFIAQTTGPDQAGTYALTIASAPAAPTVSLSVDQPQVTSGSTVDLIWSSQNATFCTASGGWSGNEALSGTVTSAPLTVSTTFTLQCTGAGGATTKSVTVTVTSASHGGGGAVSIELSASLAMLLLLRILRRPASISCSARGRSRGERWRCRRPREPGVGDSALRPR
jgi:hypothetical protein